MKEQELITALENAQSIEEVREIFLEAGVEENDFEALLNNSNDFDDEISEDELDDVSGGILLTIAAHTYISYKAIKKIKQIRKKRYQLGYDEEIMSDSRLGGTCENKK